MSRGPDVTVTTTRPGVRRVIAGGRAFPVGVLVPNVAQSTIDTLRGMRGVIVDVAGKPDADAPEPTTEE